MSITRRMKARNEKSLMSTVECNLVANKLANDDKTAAKMLSLKMKTEAAYDPISLELIPEDRKIILNSTCYDIITLSHYFSSSKDFRCPVTSIKLTENEVICIDTKSSAYALKRNCEADESLRASTRLREASEEDKSHQPCAIPPSHSTHQASHQSHQQLLRQEIVNAADDAADADDNADNAGNGGDDDDDDDGNGDDEGQKGKMRKRMRCESIDAVDASFSLPPLLPLYRRFSADLQETKSNFNEIQSLDSIIGSFISEIMDLIEDDAKETYEDFDYTVLQIFSELQQPWQEMVTLDSSAAFAYLHSYRAFLCGPPKKQTFDPNGRLQNIITLVDKLLSPEVAENHAKERRDRSFSYDSTMSLSSPLEAEGDITPTLGKRARAFSSDL